VQIVDALHEGNGGADDVDDAALVRRTQDGSREAFDVLVGRHQRNVYQLCYRFVGNHEDAADLTQDVFVRAYRAIRGFKGQSAVGTWLHRIGVNVCLNRKALKTPRFETLQAVEPLAVSEHTDVALIREERAGRVRAAISRLPPKQRATLILRMYRDLPHEEIARILGSSVGAAKANFFHAVANLKKLLTEK
jgi:RNA polymerase sigma-70 factor (ECF subfamily)